MSKNILIVEDETIIAMEIESYLLSLGYNIVAICAKADDAYNKAIENEIDLILMDIFLMEGNGIDTALKIKREKNIPIIFLTAHMDDSTINRAIEVNPIAYLAKPFIRQELFAAIKIALHKDSTQESQLLGDIVLDSEFSFDSHTLKLICCGEEIHLTKKERVLLKLFLNHKNRLLSFMKIENELWPDSPVNDNRRRSLIFRLRTKLKHQFIETYSSEGYLFKI